MELAASDAEDRAALGPDHALLAGAPMAQLDADEVEATLVLDLDARPRAGSIVVGREQADRPAREPGQLVLRRAAGLGRERPRAEPTDDQPGLGREVEGRARGQGQRGRALGVAFDADDPLDPVGVRRPLEGRGDLARGHGDLGRRLERGAVQGRGRARADLGDGPGPAQGQLGEARRLLAGELEREPGRLADAQTLRGEGLGRRPQRGRAGGPGSADLDVAEARAAGLGVEPDALPAADLSDHVGDQADRLLGGPGQGQHARAIAADLEHRVGLEAELDAGLDRQAAAVDPVLAADPHRRAARRDCPRAGLGPGQKLRALADRDRLAARVRAGLGGGPSRGRARLGDPGLTPGFATGLLAGLGLVAEQVAATQQRQHAGGGEAAHRCARTMAVGHGRARPELRRSASASACLRAGSRLRARGRDRGAPHCRPGRPRGRRG